MFHGEQFGGVVDRAVAVVVVAHRAVELVIAENAVERLGARGVCAAGRGGDVHAGRHHRRAGANQLAIHLDAGRLREVVETGTIDRVDQAISRRHIMGSPVNGDLDHSSSLRLLCNRRPTAHSGCLITIHFTPGVGPPTLIDTEAVSQALVGGWTIAFCGLPVPGWTDDMKQSLSHRRNSYTACSAMTCSISNRSLLLSSISAAPITPSTC